MKEKTNRKRNLLLGMTAMIFCMIADWFFDAKGAGNIGHGIVESNWLKMSSWRFEVSLLIGAAIVPVYWLGIREMMLIVKETCNHESKMSRFMSKLFCLGAMSGVISFVFIHIQCCLYPIIFKCIYAVYPNFNTVSSIVNKIAEYINLIPCQILQDISVAFETMGYVLLLLSGYFHCKNSENNKRNNHILSTI